MLKIKILFILLIISISGCNKGNKSSSFDDSYCTDSLPLEPHIVIYLQPYNNFTQNEANSLCEKIQQGLDSVYCGKWTVNVLSNKKLPINAYYKPRNRYLANYILKDLPNVNSPKYIIGLTHEDISYNIHGYKNYGIIGLTPLGKNKSVVSDYRAKGNNFIAAIVHEFGHGLYGAKHCSDINCIMCDYQKLKEKSFKFSLCKEHEFMN